MCGHSSGVIGFPLRLLAREVYDRVVAMKGEKQVALLTGEERIVPPHARYFLCTAESMPVSGGDSHHEGDIQRDFAFAAIDEAQLGIDPERGHVFTDRMLRARGREETLILGSDTLKPIVRELLPEAEIISRPRFSTLRYAGSVKLSRLPPRSAVVAFSAEQVYALAEMLRRFKGGAAVVMGALSPATRNAQVAMFQRGEVDYLVATDAIGMGLNMDVAHVAFAGLEKFDGRRDRRLTIAEMAQIAGRAGRHQKDGSFGTLGLGEESGGFSEEEINAIEEHRFRPLDSALLAQCRARFHRRARADRQPRGEERRSGASLGPRSDRPRGAQAHRRGSGDRGQARPGRAAAVGGMRPARFPQGRADASCAHGPAPLQLHRRGRPRSRTNGSRPRSPGSTIWPATSRRSPTASPAFAAGPISPTAPTGCRIRAKWAERTREVEGRLSDALHERLTQRFVDRRTAVLVRDIGARGADALPVTVAADGEVSVGPEPIGHLAGFEFRVDPSAKLADKRLLLAAAERRLGEELDRRASALIEAPDDAFELTVEDGGGAGASAWERRMCSRGSRPGRSLLEPAMRTARALDRLSAQSRAALRARLEQWLDAQVGKHLTFAEETWPAPRPTQRVRRGCGRSRRCSRTPAACCRARPC